MARKQAAIRPALVSHNSLVKAKPAKDVKPLNRIEKINKVTQFKKL